MPEALDADELLHLSLRAAEQNRHDEAIEFLKRGLQLEPLDARLHYLLGAERAQIGMFDRAVEDIARAVELNPSLHTAGFQLGLLHLTAGRVEQAEQAWRGLDALEAEHCLRLFRDGLLHLARDEFAGAADCLKRGIAANTINPALSRDMQRVLGEVEQRADAPAERPAQPGTRAPLRVLLSAYGKERADGADED